MMTLTSDVEKIEIGSRDKLWMCKQRGSQLCLAQRAENCFDVRNMESSENVMRFICEEEIKSQSKVSVEICINVLETRNVWFHEETLQQYRGVKFCLRK